MTLEFFLMFRKESFFFLVFTYLSQKYKSEYKQHVQSMHGACAAKQHHTLF